MIDGILDGFPVKIIYRSNGFDFTNIKVKSGEVIFQWDQLSVLQQIQILQQLENTLPLPEQNFN